MMIRNKSIYWFLVLIGALVGSSAHARGHGGQLIHGGYGHGGGGHYHGHYPRGYDGPGYGYYGDNRGGFFWGGFPNVIINVPARPYYPPICEDVEVCDPYDRCWIEQQCSR